MCSKRINVIELNSCLNVKNTVYAPYALLRTRLKVNIENLQAVAAHLTYQQKLLENIKMTD